MNNSLYIDIHAIQTLPPSCVNRDDTGSPKTAVYGGVERARVSSQAWKHAMREYFKTVFPQDSLGSRTKHVPEMLAKAIAEKNSSFTPDMAKKAAIDALKYIGIKIDEKKEVNKALFFISRQQIEALAQLAVDGEKNKKAYEEAIRENPSLDIVLFGRMVADDASLNYDAAAQVAHAISTHEVHTEYDYFTAVDDEQSEEQSGAAHLDTVEFNSSTLYRYATLNVSEILENLGGDTPKVICGFIEAFTRSMPTGKLNTFANRTLPDMLYVTARGDQPVNFSGAFENAVVDSGEGYINQSCNALLAYAEKLYSSFADKPEKAWGCGCIDILSEYSEVKPLKELLKDVEAYVTEICNEA